MKLLKSIRALFLMLFSLKILKPQEIFKNKRVAVIGAADSAFNKEMGEYIDGFDIVIRVNKAPHTWNIDKERFIGSRTDIWFHNFFENTDSGGGGPIDFELIKKMNIKFLVNPLNYFEAYRRTFNFYRKYNHSINVYHLPLNFSKIRDRKFGRRLKPTIGFTALYSVLNSECSELYITGFTFWKTPYVKGYRDHVLDLEDNKNHFKKQGIHDADLEYELFKFELNNTSCKAVKVDDKLREILNGQ